MFTVYFRGLDALSKKVKASTVDLPIESVSLSLQDLIGYFHPPDEHLEHEDKQNRLRALKNRQNLFQEEASFYQLSFVFCHCLGKTTTWWGNFSFWYLCILRSRGARIFTVQENSLGGVLQWVLILYQWVLILNDGTLQSLAKGCVILPSTQLSH